jgi:hypothetical protein
MSVQLKQKINQRLGTSSIDNWDEFWVIYFDEVNQNNYQEVLLKNLITMNSPPNKIDFTDCFEKMLFTVMKFINIDRNPFKNNGIIDNDFMNYIINNFDINIIYTLTDDNAVEDYLNDLVFNDANLAIDIKALSLKLPSELISIISDSYIDDTYKLRQNIEDLLQLDNPINRTPEMISSLKAILASNKNPHSFDVIKKFVKNGILTFDQELFIGISDNSNDEAVDLIINNLQTPQNPNGIILNTGRLQISLARNTNIRALNFFAENYRQGYFFDVFDNRIIYSNPILRNLLENENSFPILENLGIINQIRTNIANISLLAYNISDDVVNMVMPYLIGLNYQNPNSLSILTHLAINTNPIAVKAIISYLRVYTTFLISSGRTADLHFGQIIRDLSKNSNNEAVDYIFEIFNNVALNYQPDYLFWLNYMLNKNDRAVNYILDNINIIYALPHSNHILRIASMNKHHRMREYVMDNYLNIHNDIVKFDYLFLNEDIFEIDEQDRQNKTQQIKTFMNNVYASLNGTDVNRDQTIYGLE